MSKFCPAYPKPVERRWQALWRLWRGRDSLLEQLTTTAYRMQMGRIRTPGHQMFIVNDPDEVRKVLIEQSDGFPKHRYMDDLLRPLLGRSIFTSNGDPWRSQRRMMEQAFEQTRMEFAFPRMVDAVDTLMDRLRVLPDGAVCDIETEMTHFTADVIFRTIFSEPLSADDARRIFAAFGVFQHESPKATMPRYRPRWWGWWNTGGHEQTAAAAAGEIRALLRRLVEPRFHAFRSGAPSVHNDILEALLQARDAATERAMDVEELVNEIAVLFLAGHETSASALAWTFYFLAHSPDVQAKVQAEIDTVIGSSPPALERLQKLELTRRVFRETLRLYPPLGFLVREAAADGCLRDQPVKKGAAVVISPWLIHRHTKFWERPDEFDPDRFLSESGRASAGKAFLPFSIGPRVCVGAGFALQEAALVISSMVREFRFSPVPGAQPQPVARLSLRSDIGVRVHLGRRSPAPP
ncbi:MAG: cytochrome P450 [Ramlibacter sp.]